MHRLYIDASVRCIEELRRNPFKGFFSQPKPVITTPNFATFDPCEGKVQTEVVAKGEGDDDFQR